ncbi:hypothetical protein, partial [Mesorhizobium sp.]|uniref:hypothetical protein n=1 Tax=Mesorhizobium sp. TaxID=1871066 RepID=UPI002579792C
MVEIIKSPPTWASAWKVELTAQNGSAIAREDGGPAHDVAARARQYSSARMIVITRDVTFRSD